MKKIAFLLIFAFSAALIFAHAPSDITIKYDAAKKSLSVKVMHDISGTKVTEPAKHFVKDIIVTVNGKAVKTDTLTSQKTAAGTETVYPLELKAGDKVSVTSSCNLSGTKSAELVIK